MIDNIYVFDDVVSKNYQDLIEQKVMDNEYFPWYFVASITKTVKQANSKDGFGFSHLFYNSSAPNPEMSPYGQIFLPLAYEACAKINFMPSEILIGRIFMTLAEEERRRNLFHIDMPQPHMVCLYYVNDSTGPTVITSAKGSELPSHAANIWPGIPIKREVEPKKGRAVLFNGDLYHASTTPDTGRRCVINFDIR
jgi:hypothetical protein